MVILTAYMAFASPIPEVKRVKRQFDLGQLFTQVTQQFAQPAPQTNTNTDYDYYYFDSFNQPTQSGSSGGGYAPRPGTKPKYG